MSDKTPDQTSNQTPEPLKPLQFIKTLVPLIDKYKNEKYLELEFRLGHLKLNEKKNFTFNTDISEEFFNKIKEELDNSTAFKSKETNEIKDEFSEKIRRSVTRNANSTTVNTTQIIIKKEKLCTIDFNLDGTPFDIRVSFSKEVPVKNFDESKIEYTRTKKRNTYVYKKFNYDLTEVSGTTSGVEAKSYEFELELNKTINAVLKTCSVEELLESTYMKLIDIVKMCENVEDEDVSVVLHEVKSYAT